MFENSYPLFNSGRLLKIDMLEALRDFPRGFFDIRLKEYSDGIISGCDIEVKDDFIKIKRGLIKYHDAIYILKTEESIDYKSNNEMMILKVKFLPLVEDSDFVKNPTEVYLDEKLEIEANEIEICRFKLRTGAKLRINHVDFNDLSTEYDTVNTIDEPLCNLMFFLEFEGKILMGTFCCSYEEYGEWRECIFEVVKSIRVRREDKGDEN